MTENPEEIIKYGVFKGFNIFVFVTIILQAMTGLVSDVMTSLLSPLSPFCIIRAWHW